MKLDWLLIIQWQKNLQWKPSNESDRIKLGRNVPHNICRI